MGSKNLAYCVLDNKQIVTLDFFHATLTDLIDPNYNQDLRKFTKEFRALLRKYKPNAVIIERFQNRGMFRGNSSELLNVMIGLMSSICLSQKIYVYLATAAQWKLAYSRQFKEQERVIVVEKKVRGMVKKLEKKQTALDVLYERLHPFPNHTVDAHLQAWYLAHLNEKNQYANWKPKQLTAWSKKWVKNEH